MQCVLCVEFEALAFAALNVYLHVLLLHVQECVPTVYVSSNKQWMLIIVGISLVVWIPILSDLPCPPCCLFELSLFISHF